MAESGGGALAPGRRRAGSVPAHRRRHHGVPLARPGCAAAGRRGVPERRRSVVRELLSAGAVLQPHRRCALRVPGPDLPARAEPAPRAARDPRSGLAEPMGGRSRRAPAGPSSTFAHAVPDTPLDYRARQTFALREDGLEIALELTNAGAGPMPAGLGHHPYFIRTDGVTLRARLDHVWLPDERKIPQQRVPLPAAWDFADGRRLASVDLDHCFGGWDGRAELHWPELDLTLRDRGGAYLPASRDLCPARPGFLLHRAGLARERRLQHARARRRGHRRARPRAGRRRSPAPSGCASCDDTRPGRSCRSWWSAPGRPVSRRRSSWPDMARTCASSTGTRPAPRIPRRSGSTRARSS